MESLNRNQFYAVILFPCEVQPRSPVSHKKVDSQVCTL
jgi:hypothetical protein